MSIISAYGTHDSSQSDSFLLLAEVLKHLSFILHWFPPLPPSRLFDGFHSYLLFLSFWLFLFLITRVFPIHLFIHSLKKYYWQKHLLYARLLGLEEMGVNNCRDLWTHGIYSLTGKTGLGDTFHKYLIINHSTCYDDKAWGALGKLPWGSWDLKEN